MKRQMAVMAAVLATAVGAMAGRVEAQATAEKFSFGLTLPGFTAVDAGARYAPDKPGFEQAGGAFPKLDDDHFTADRPFFFSVTVPEGNYQVTVRLGGSAAAQTTVKAELRRLMLDKIPTKAGESVSKTFAVSVRRPPIVDAEGKDLGMTKVKAREGRQGALNRAAGGEGFSWDDALTLEFSGTPALQAIEIHKFTPARQVFLCGDSTMCDQPAEPYTSWGQMITRWFAPDTVVSNLAISGETMPAFLGENRLAKITSQLQPGDFVLVQFGHNDMKSTAPDALQTYKKNLLRFISETRAKGGVPVLLTPVSRESFVDGKISNSFIVKHGGAAGDAPADDYLAAVKQVASEQQVTLIDLNASSAALYEAFGPEKAQVLFATPKEKTHHSDFGSYEIAKCVVQGIVDAKLELAQHLSPDWKPFDPSKPDSEEAVDPVKDVLPGGRGAAPAGN